MTIMTEVSASTHGQKPSMHTYVSCLLTSSCVQTEIVKILWLTCAPEHANFLLASASQLSVSMDRESDQKPAFMLLLDTPLSYSV
eukprot:scaffold207368_cov21-Tisochrysis_lutea.AAC.2